MVAFLGLLTIVSLAISGDALLSSKPKSTARAIAAVVMTLGLVAAMIVTWVMKTKFTLP